MNWLAALGLAIAAYLIWHTLWLVLPLLAGVLFGIGLQERFPRLAGLIGDVIVSFRAPVIETRPTPKRQPRRK